MHSKPCWLLVALGLVTVLADKYGTAVGDHRMVFSLCLGTAVHDELAVLWQTVWLCLCGKWFTH